MSVLRRLLVPVLFAALFLGVPVLVLGLSIKPDPLIVQTKEESIWVRTQ